MSKKKTDSDKKPKEKKPAKASKKATVEPTSNLPANLPVLVSNPAVAKEDLKPVAKPKAKPASKKVAKAPAKSPARKKTAPVVAISNDDIALRAYYIAERRQKMGWPGDSTGDWVEAERQLRAEAKKVL